MPAKSNTDTLVLALVSEGPIHGYDLVKRSRENRISDWADIPSSSVYQSLKRLEKNGHIKAKEVRIGKSPPRAVYRITKSGKTALSASLLRLLTEPIDLRSDFDIALLGIELLPEDKALKALEIHRGQTERIYSEIETFYEANKAKLGRSHKFIYKRLIEQYRSHLEFLAEIESILRQK